MRTIEVKVFTFFELSETGKQKAIDGLRDINVSHDWWDCIYEDAKEIGLRITSFDLDRNRHANGEFILFASEVANKIIGNHGETRETYKTAKYFLSKWDELVEKYSDGEDTTRVAEGKEYEFDGEADDLENEFLRDLLEDYSLILQMESEYLMSDEAIVEVIEANKYEFTEYGKIV